MCGIAGIYDCAGAAEAATVRAMTRRMTHRGPDGEGFHVDRHVALGMRRLAIIDVAHGEQPLYNEARDVVAVFNGEIYNHAELRDRLARDGHSFRSHSDGEVLPHLYEELGERFVDHLNGIFAIALWDARRGTLVLARDRLGVKPLYWSRTAGRVSFASELKALLADETVPRSLDLAAVDSFLTFRFFPSPATPLEGVRKLRPATTLSIAGDDERERNYWRPDERVSSAGADELVERYSGAFERAVIGQMMSDRPIGVMLSGGVDSGAITSVMARHAGRVNTFTIGFAEGGDADETKLAEQTARMFSTHHESLVVSAADYLSRLPDSYAVVEEPIGTSSALAVQYVSELMRSTVPVGMSGQGADELMGGYWRYVGTAIAQATRPLAPLAAAAARLPAGRLAVRLRRGLATVAAGDDIDVLMRAYSLFDPAAKRRLYRPEVLDQLGSSEPRAAVEALSRQVAGRPLLDQMLHVDTRLWLPDELLLIADKMSMAASVELRVPFLDPEVVAIAESIPGNLRVHHLRRKHLHKRAMCRWLPREVVYRKERGWSTPMGSWLRAELLPLLRDVLLSPEGAPTRLFRESEMTAMIDDHRSGRRDLTRQLFALLSLGLWERSFLSAATPAATAEVSGR